jgi:chorismate mutase
MTPQLRKEAFKAVHAEVNQIKRRLDELDAQAVQLLQDRRGYVFELLALAYAAAGDLMQHKARA